jgi:hypothetical protein
MIASSKSAAVASIAGITMRSFEIFSRRMDSILFRMAGISGGVRESM